VAAAFQPRSSAIEIEVRPVETSPPRRYNVGMAEVAVGRVVTAQMRRIARCGMNCSICLAYLRESNKCPGCGDRSTYKAPTRVRCVIKNCEVIGTNGSGFCYECAGYPCKRLKQLDKRYRTKYAMSMIANLESIRDLGLKAFVQNESERWHCPTCGGTICVHRGRCLNCGG
jgi:hypothetical protein